METTEKLVPSLPEAITGSDGADTNQESFINHDRLLTAEDIAKYFQVKPKTIYNWAEQGLIPCYRITNRILRFELEKVKEWFKGFERPGRKPYKSEFNPK